MLKQELFVGGPSLIKRAALMERDSLLELCIH